MNTHTYPLRSVLRQGFMLLLLASSLKAQAPGTGAIAGTISDPTGAVVANARVSAVSNTTASAWRLLNGH
jgi:hypothetical protein